MSLPILPPFYQMKIANPDGSMTSEAILFNDEQSQTLVKAIDLINMIATSLISNTGSVSYNGLVPPSYTAAEITALAVDAELGTIWFNTDSAKLNVLTAPGVVETITST
jgi:hypothetical protein